MVITKGYLGAAPGTSTTPGVGSMVIYESCPHCGAAYQAGMLHCCGAMVKATATAPDEHGRILDALKFVQSQNDKLHARVDALTDALYSLLKALQELKR